MRLHRIILAGAFALVLAPVAIAAPSAVKGKEIFHRVGCYECHNYQGQGGVGPRLAPSSIAFDRLKSYVRNANGNMPPYAPTVLPDDDIADIYAYLQSIPKAPAADSITAVKNLKTAAP
jgi:mono/diheme cytochrome c family protein